MGWMESAKSVIDKGASLAGSAVDSVSSAASNIAIEQMPFMRELLRTCKDGFDQGWHEANGGNISYILSDDEKTQVAQRAIANDDDAWICLDTPIAEMAGTMVALTAAGSCMRDIADNARRDVGIIQIDECGGSYRVLWGFEEGRRPTSELSAHLMAHAARRAATGNENRVLYHTHPINIIALTKIAGANGNAITKVLWQAMTECMIVFPEGLAALPRLVPGSSELAEQTAHALCEQPGVIWAHHGLFASGKSFSEAFGLVHTADKAARIYLTARAALGSKTPFESNLTEKQLRHMADELKLPINEEIFSGSAQAPGVQEQKDHAERVCPWANTM